MVFKFLKAILLYIITMGNASSADLKTEENKKTGLKEKIFGVNFGGVFLPEEWLPHTCKDFFDDIPGGFDRGSKSNRPSLSHLTTEKFAEKMIPWISDHIQEEDFYFFQQQGVNVLRVPTGYWNWVTTEYLPDGPYQDRMKVLYTIPAEQYIPYFDQIFELAAKYDIKILLDLHGLPGSQNMEMHSGLNGNFDEKNCTPGFRTQKNLVIALQAIENMAKYGQKYEGTTLFGIQVLNEYRPTKFGDVFGCNTLYKFLDSYYEQSIHVIRQHLSREVPVVTYAYVFDFFKFSKNRFVDFQKYGNVLWDTHLYGVGNHFNFVMWWCNFGLKLMNKWQKNSVIVGEWSLSGYQEEREEEKYHARTERLLNKFHEKSLGTFYWNFFGWGTWSFQHMSKSIDWQKILKKDEQDADKINNILNN